jgi:hypothetical protein
MFAVPPSVGGRTMVRSAGGDARRQGGSRAPARPRENEDSQLGRGYKLPFSARGKNFCRIFYGDYRSYSPQNPWGLQFVGMSATSFPGTTPR